MKDNMTPLTDVLEFIVDNRGKTVPTSDSGTPLIATNCIKHSSIYPTFDNIRYVNDEIMKTWFRAHPKPNDIIFVNKGTPGRVCLVPDPVSFCFAQDMMGFRCDPEKIDYQYLFAVLRSDFIQEKIENFHVGLVIPHFKKGDLGHIKIPRLSSRQLELAVGELYIKLSKKIELNNQINAELEAMAKTLYDYWFVQFDFPYADGKPYKASGGKMVYNEVLKREIPENWEESTLANHLSCNMNKLGNIHQLKVLQYLDTSSLTENVIDSFQKLTLGIDKVPSRANMVVSKNDILYSTVRPNLLHYGLIKQPIENMIASTGYAVLSHKTDSNLNVAFYLHITSKNNTKKLINISQSSKSSYPSISPNDILNTSIALPLGSDILSKFCSISNPIFDKVSKVQAENKKLEELRDWLLPMLMNGQVTVKQ